MTEHIPATQPDPASSGAHHHRARTILRNTIFGMAAQVGLRGLAFLFNIFIVRQLSDVGYGDYSVVLAWTGIFSFIGDLGITQYMSREVARDRDKALTLFWDVTILRLILAIITIVITVVGAILAGYNRDLVIAMAVFSSTYFIQAFLTPLAGIINGYERLDILSVITLVGQLIYYAAATVFLLLNPTYLWLVIASWVNLPIVTAISAWVVARNNMRPPSFALHPRSWFSLLRFGFPFAFIQVSLTFAFRFDTLILERDYPREVVGWYNAAYTLTRSLLMFTGAFMTALVPTLARQHALDPESIVPVYFRSVRFIAFLGLPLAVGGMLLADKIILTTYGPEFGMAILAFAILIWDTPLLMYTSICGNFTTVTRTEKFAALVYGLEGVFNIVMNVLLIPRYGLLAASLVTVGTELVGTILFYRIFRRNFGAGLGLMSLSRLAASLAVMGLVVYWLRELNMFFTAGVGALVYCLMVWLTRVLMPEERALLSGLVARLRSRLQRAAP